MKPRTKKEEIERAIAINKEEAEVLERSAKIHREKIAALCEELRAVEVVTPHLTADNCGFMEMPVALSAKQAERTRAFAYAVAVADKIGTTDGDYYLPGRTDQGRWAACGRRFPKAERALFRFATEDKCDLFVRSVGNELLNLIYGA